jgi:hypothetical protein
VESAQCDGVEGREVSGSADGRRRLEVIAASTEAGYDGWLNFGLLTACGSV